MHSERREDVQPITEKETTLPSYPNPEAYWVSVIL